MVGKRSVDSFQISCKYSFRMHIKLGAKTGASLIFIYSVIFFSYVIQKIVSVITDKIFLLAI